MTCESCETLLRRADRHAEVWAWRERDLQRLDEIVEETHDRIAEQRGYGARWSWSEGQDLKEMIRVDKRDREASSDSASTRHRPSRSDTITVGDVHAAQEWLDAHYLSDLADHERSEDERLERALEVLARAREYVPRLYWSGWAGRRRKTLAREVLGALLGFCEKTIRNRYDEDLERLQRGVHRVDEKPAGWRTSDSDVEADLEGIFEELMGARSFGAPDVLPDEEKEPVTDETILRAARDLFE